MERIRKNIILNKKATKKLIAMVTGPGQKPADTITGLNQDQIKKIEKYIKWVFIESYKKMREKNPICGNVK